MLRFGVEIEVTKLSVQAAIDMLRNNKAFTNDIKLSDTVSTINWFDDWLVKEDGSIHPYGSELVSPIFTWQNRGQVFEMIDLLKRNWAKCNQSCGFHVHMSGDFPEKWKEMCPIIEVWYKRIKLGFKPAKSRRDEYCIEKLDQAKYRICRPVITNPESIESYCAGEWKVSKPHIEVRLFNSRLCKRWIWRCLKVCKQLGELLEEQKIIAV
jgi:hypothetical protein